MRSEKMADRISVPLSVDVERGYGETGRQVKENIRRLLRAGASGFNLEDGQSDGALSPVELQIEKIRAIAELKERRNRLCHKRQDMRVLA